MTAHSKLETEELIIAHAAALAATFKSLVGLDKDKLDQEIRRFDFLLRLQVSLLVERAKRET